MQLGGRVPTFSPQNCPGGASGWWTLLPGRRQAAPAPGCVLLGVLASGMYRWVGQGPPQPKADVQGVF